MCMAGLISSDTFDALILASLISILISPICLRLVLVDERNEKELEIARARSETMYVGEGVEPELFSESSEVFAGPTGPKHHLYFQLQTKSHGMFGHQDKLLAAIGKLKMSVIDYRSFHPHGDFNVHVVNEVYLKDNDTLVYDHSSKSEADTATCKRRMGELYKVRKRRAKRRAKRPATRRANRRAKRRAKRRASCWLWVFFSHRVCAGGDERLERGVCGH